MAASPDRTDAVDPGGSPVPTDFLVGRETRIGSGSALTLATRVTGLGTSFLVGVLVARAFGVAGKGALAVVVQVPALLVVALDLGIATSIIYFVSRGRLRPGTAAANALTIAMILGALGAPFIWLLLSGPLAIIPGVPLSATAVAISMLPLGLCTVWLMSVCTGLSDLTLPLLCTVAASATTLLGLLILVLQGQADLTSVLAMSAAGTATGICVLLVGLRSRLAPFAADLTAFHWMARFSAKAYLSNIAEVFHQRQDVLLLGWLAGTVAAGLYSVGVVFAQLVWFVPTALSTAILAKGTRRNEAAAVDYTIRATRVAVIFMFATVLVCLLVVPWLIPLLYGRAFAPAIFSFLALLPGALADGTSRVLWSYQLTRGRIYWQMAVASTVLNVVVLLVLVPALGAVGAGLASSVSYVVLAMLVLRRFCADTGTHARDVLVPRRTDVDIIARTTWSLLSHPKTGD